VHKGRREKKKQKRREQVTTASWLVRLAKFRTRFADTMALYFFGQLASPNSFLWRMLVGAAFIWFRSTSKIFPNVLAKIQQKQQKSKAKRGNFNGMVVYFDVRIGFTYYGNNCRL
jgi:hypothetical protein